MFIFIISTDNNVKTTSHSNLDLSHIASKRNISESDVLTTFLLAHLKKLADGPFHEGLAQTSRQFYGPETRGRYLGEPVPMAVSKLGRGGTKTTQKVTKSHRGMADQVDRFVPLCCYYLKFAADHAIE